MAATIIRKTTALTFESPKCLQFAQWVFIVRNVDTMRSTAIGPFGTEQEALDNLARLKEIL